MKSHTAVVIMFFLFMIGICTAYMSLKADGGCLP